MAIAQQIFIVWPSDKDNVKLFLYFYVLVVYNMNLEMIPVVERALI